MRLPEDANAAITMSVDADFQVEVREVGGAGVRGRAGKALQHSSARGTAYWTATAGAGAEEWLLVNAVRGVPVGEWEVKGGVLRQDQASVAILDGGGRSRLTVTAPESYGPGGAPVSGRLAVAGSRIQLFVAAQGLVLADPLWTVTGALPSGRMAHTSMTLPNGQVLVTGGLGITLSRIADCCVYNPSSGTWSCGPSLLNPRAGHTATLLQDGRVLVAGGSMYLSGAELWQPYATSWTQTAPMFANRMSHTATLLPNGKVLVVGGTPETTSCELFDPVTNQWSLTGSESGARVDHTATLLANGKVLVAGGSHAGVNLNTAALYNPSSGTWSSTGSLATARSSHTASLLPNGKVLVTGGSGGGGRLASAELYDPASGSWSPFASLSGPRAIHTAEVLTGGRILVAAGWNGAALNTAEVYNPQSGAWVAGGALSQIRAHHRSSPLSDGKILISGGVSGTRVLATTELYAGICGNGVIDPAEQCDGETCCSSTCTVTEGTCYIGGSCYANGTTNPNSPCQECNATLNQLAWSNKAGNPPCDDGDACTYGETCSGSGVCTGGTSITCSDDQCNTRACNGTASCTVTPLTGVPCDDGDACTQTDTCEAGTCVGSNPVVCPFPDSCGGGGVPGQCGCTGRTCSASDCGAVLDGCGGTLLCPCNLDPSCGG